MENETSNFYGGVTFLTDKSGCTGVGNFFHFDDYFILTD